MVKVKVPMNTPVDDELDNMGDESDLDDDIDDPDWEEVRAEDDDEDLVKLAWNLPRTTRNGDFQIHVKRPKRGKDDGPAAIQIGGGESSDDGATPGKKRKLDFEEIVRRRLNRQLIEKQMNKHKMSLLLYLARGIRLVKVVNCDIIKCLSLSLIDNWLLKQVVDANGNKVESASNAKTNGKIKTTTKGTPPKETAKKRKESSSKRTSIRAGLRNSVVKKNETLIDENSNSDIIELYNSHSPPKYYSPKKCTYKNEREFVEVFMTWFNSCISICDEKREEHLQKLFIVNLIECFATKEVTCLLELVIMFIACLKAAKPHVPVRLVNILRPITMRADIIVKPNSKAPTQTKCSTEEKLDYWLEVYLSDEKRWACVDLSNCKIDEPNVLNELNRPFYYVLSFDIDRCCVKPAESTYCQDWYTPGFKRERCDPKWWDVVISLLGPSEKEDLDHADEERNQEVLLTQELPKSEAAYKNHPLYVIIKHLLKFQGIYPSEVDPVGFFKDLPVYPRDCVHTLMSREKWLRNARSVKLNETPYKIVKARPKRDRFSKELVRDLPLELFGEWQTEDYVLPQAVDGKVPRNVYGNVDMYKDCMLPKGCTWLKLNGLPRIANKLGIDCAAAVTGFDCNSGSFGSHPIIDGFIVCNEYAETLQMAWEEEQENIRKRELEKRCKRILDNWKRLIKSARIREILRHKYKD